MVFEVTPPGSTKLPHWKATVRLACLVREMASDRTASPEAAVSRDNVRRLKCGTERSLNPDGAKPRIDGPWCGEPTVVVATL